MPVLIPGVGVRLPPRAPSIRYTNTVSTASLAVDSNRFALIVDIDDYEGKIRLQTKCATYKQIQAWVKQKYGIDVSNHVISQAKKRCGLIEPEHKGGKGHDVPKLNPEKEAAIRKAFIWFGMIKDE